MPKRIPMPNNVVTQGNDAMLIRREQIKQNKHWCCVQRSEYDIILPCIDHVFIRIMPFIWKVVYVGCMVFVCLRLSIYVRYLMVVQYMCLIDLLVSYEGILRCFNVLIECLSIAPLTHVVMVTRRFAFHLQFTRVVRGRRDSQFMCLFTMAIARKSQHGRECKIISCRDFFLLLMTNVIVYLETMNNLVATSPTPKHCNLKGFTFACHLIDTWVEVRYLHDIAYNPLKLDGC